MGVWRGQVVRGGSVWEDGFSCLKLVAGFCDRNFEPAPRPELKIEPIPHLPLPIEFGENFITEEQSVQNFILVFKVFKNIFLMFIYL